MCSRYFIDDAVLSDIKVLTAHTFSPALTDAPRDVCPGQTAPVIIQRDDRFDVSEMRWGFPRYTGSGLLINARSETALEKRTFRDSVLHRRCVIPARHFYEWDASKTKVTFFPEDEGILYMAGAFDWAEDEGRFVILTTPANASVAPVHHRMPLILEQEDMEPWLTDPGSTGLLLQKTPSPLCRTQDYEQLSLFDL